MPKQSLPFPDAFSVGRSRLVISANRTALGFYIDQSFTVGLGLANDFGAIALAILAFANDASIFTI